MQAGRQDELRVLRVEDVIDDFVFNDGIRGPALRLYPGKTSQNTHNVQVKT